MLTDEQIYANKVKLLDILKTLNIKYDALCKYLEDNDYFDKPATTTHFMAYRGGLCEYTLRLCYELGSLANAYFPGKYTKENIVIVAFFKNLYRCELYEFFQKNVKNEETGQWELKGAYRYNENRRVFGDLGFSSYMVAKEFVDLTDEEIEAITQSDTNNSYAGDIHRIMREYPLVTLLQMADLALTYLSKEV